MITLIDNNNFKIFRTFIQECIDFSAAGNFFSPLEDYKIETYKDLVLYAQSEKIYVPSKNNKSLGFFVIRNNYVFNTSSISYFSNPVLCKLSVISLLHAAIDEAIEDSRISMSESLTAVFSNLVLQRNFSRKFKEIKTGYVDKTFVFASANLSEGNIVNE